MEMYPSMCPESLKRSSAPLAEQVLPCVQVVEVSQLVGQLLEALLEVLQMPWQLIMEVLQMPWQLLMKVPQMPWQLPHTLFLEHPCK